MYMFRINAIRVESNVSVRLAIYQLSICVNILMLRFSGTLTCMDLNRSWGYVSHDNGIDSIEAYFCVVFRLW